MTSNLWIKFKKRRKKLLRRQRKRKENVETRQVVKWRTKIEIAVSKSPILTQAARK